MKSILLYVLIFSFSYFASKNFSKKPNRIECVKNQRETVSHESDIDSKNSLPLKKTNSLCPTSYTKKLIESSSKYEHFSENKEEHQAITRTHQKIEFESTDFLDDNEKEVEIKRLKSLKNSPHLYNLDYPRFNVSTKTPSGAHYFGIHIGKYSDVERFLGDRICPKPTFNYVSNPKSYQSAFFTINTERAFSGIVRIINEKFTTLIQASFSLGKFLDRPYHRYIPDGFFSMQTHKDLPGFSKSYVYEANSIDIRRTNYRDSDTLPWLYNSCTKSIATINNYCSLDPSYDMQYKDFFYLVDYDLLLGNIYCKKSHEQTWSRISTIELRRVK